MRSCREGGIVSTAQDCSNSYFRFGLHGVSLEKRLFIKYRKICAKNQSRLMMMPLGERRKEHRT
jgi:hypothetical protein